MALVAREFLDGHTKLSNPINKEDVGYRANEQGPKPVAQQIDDEQKHGGRGCTDTHGHNTLSNGVLRREITVF